MDDLTARFEMSLKPDAGGAPSASEVRQSGERSRARRVRAVTAGIFGAALVTGVALVGLPREPESSDVLTLAPPSTHSEDPPPSVSGLSSMTSTTPTSTTNGDPDSSSTIATAVAPTTRDPSSTVTTAVAPTTVDDRPSTTSSTKAPALDNEGKGVWRSYRIGADDRTISLSLECVYDEREQFSRADIDYSETQISINVFVLYPAHVDTSTCGPTVEVGEVQLILDEPVGGRSIVQFSEPGPTVPRHR